jgi:hypothetical protein
MYKNRKNYKNNKENNKKSFTTVANERTIAALGKILGWAEIFTIDNLCTEKTFKRSLHNMQEVLGRFSNNKKLQALYDEIRGIDKFPDENIRLILLKFYYAGMDLLEKAKKREEKNKE